MSRQTRRNSLIIGAALTLAAATANAAEPGEGFERAALQAELAPLAADARSQAADVGREVAARALSATHCVTLQTRPKLAATHRAQPERS